VRYGCRAVSLRFDVQFSQRRSFLFPLLNRKPPPFPSIRISTTPLQHNQLLLYSSFAGRPVFFSFFKAPPCPLIHEGIADSLVSQIRMSFPGLPSLSTPTGVFSPPLSPGWRHPLPFSAVRRSVPPPGEKREAAGSRPDQTGKQPAFFSCIAAIRLSPSPPLLSRPCHFFSFFLDIDLIYLFFLCCERDESRFKTTTMLLLSRTVPYRFLPPRGRIFFLRDWMGQAFVFLMTFSPPVVGVVLQLGHGSTPFPLPE